MTVLAEVRKMIDATNVSKLARESEVSRGQLTRIENGLTDPGLETVERILNTLGYQLKIVKKGTDEGRMDS